MSIMPGVGGNTVQFEVANIKVFFCVTVAKADADDINDHNSSTFSSKLFLPNKQGWKF